MRCRAYCVVSGVVFVFVFLAHLLRIVFLLPVHVGSATVPMLLSWGGMIGPAALAVWAFWTARTHIRTR